MSSPAAAPAAERRWGAGGRPLPLRWAAARKAVRVPGTPPFNFSAHLRAAVADVAVRVPEFAHVDPAAILHTFTASRTRSKFGLLARITPLRFRGGGVERRHRGGLYRVQRYFVDRREQLYVFTCCLPRFLDLPFEEKWVTIFHELWHVGPAFDGDLRRHGGRYEYHTRSKKGYDERMAALVRRYLAAHPDPSAFAFLHRTFDQLWADRGGIYGVKVPRPAMVPVASSDPGGPT